MRLVFPVSKHHLTAFLAAWFGVIGLSQSYVHAHEGGNRPHRHSSNWPSPFAPSGNGLASDLHRHLVCFGLDLGNFSLETAPPTIEVGAQANMGPSGTAVPSALEVQTLLDSQFDANPLFSVAVEPELSSLTGPRPHPSSLVALCPVRTHTVSGVLLS